MAWQPIKTAPKDGTWVLVVTNTRKERRAAVARYAGDWRDHWIIADIEPNGTNKVYGVYVNNPTHWQPIDKLPPEPRRKKTTPVPGPLEHANG